MSADGLPMYTPQQIQEILQGMRTELTHVGASELRTPEEVDACFGYTDGTTLLMVNSVCGCAAGNARPGVALALQNTTIPDRVHTVFAGQDREATERARAHMPGLPPSSPSVFLLKDGEVVFVLHRHQIEGRTARMVAYDLVSAFNTHCTAAGPSVPPEVFVQSPSVQVCGSTIPSKEEIDRMTASGTV